MLPIDSQREGGYRVSPPWSLGFQHGDIAHHEVHAGSPEPHPTLVAVTVAGGATIRNGIMLVSHIR